MSQFTDEKLRFRELSASSDTATKWQSQDLNTGLSDSKTDALSSIQGQCEEEYNWLPSQPFLSNIILTSQVMQRKPWTQHC